MYKDFEELNSNACEAFLQTVVVVDNQPFVHGSRTATPRKATRKRSAAPGMSASMTTAAPDSAPSSDVKEAVAEVVEVVEVVEESSHILELNTVANAFAQKRLTCGVYLPTLNSPAADDELIETACKAILPADACVLDWQLRENDSSQARQIIKRICKEDNEAGGKLRLIIVYTAEPDVTGAAAGLSEELDGVELKKEDVPILVGKHLRIVFLNKPTTIGRHVGDATCVHWTDLPDRVIQEFTTLSTGLLRAHALQAVAAIRNDMHRIIAQFDEKYDATFVADRASKTDPDDGARLVSEILASELNLTTGASESAQFVLSAAGCRLWLTDTNAEGRLLDQDRKPKLRDGSESQIKKIDDAARIHFIDHGIGAFKENVGNMKLGDAVRMAFASDQDEREEAERSFAVLSTLASHSGTVASRRPFIAPRLTLGTILSDGGGDVYLCLQPRCDSVRMEAERGFLFVKLVRDAKRIQFILPQDNALAEFRLPRSDERFVQTVLFPPNEGLDCVEAKKSEKGWKFSDRDGGQWNWVAELREGYAAQVAHSLLGNQLARPGLNQLEWLRMRSG